MKAGKEMKVVKIVSIRVSTRCGKSALTSFSSKEKHIAKWKREKIRKYFPWTVDI